MGELNLEGRPLAAHHHADRIQPDRHAILVLLARSWNIQIGHNVSHVGSLPFDNHRCLARLVIELDVARYLRVSLADGRRVQYDVGQWTDIFGIEPLAEV